MGSKKNNYDWTDTTQCHIIKINYPGYGENEIQVQFEETRGLGVYAKYKKEDKREEKEENSKREAEIHFWKIISLLEDNVKMNEISASMDNSKLIVVKPKKDATPLAKPSLHIEEIGHWKEYGANYIFEMNFQGFKWDKIEIIVQEGTYLIVKEKQSGNIMNIFTMIDNIKKDEMKSSMENGVLTINIPKDVSQPPSKNTKMMEIPFT